MKKYSVMDFFKEKQDIQIQTIRAMITSCIKIGNCNTDRNGNAAPLAMVQWIKNDSDYMQIVNQAWIKLHKFFYLSFGKALFRAVWYSVREIYNSEHKHGRAETEKEIDSIQAEKAYIQSTEAAALIKYRVFAACNDHVDKKIVKLLMYGYTKKEIAEIIGVSRQTVHNRINKIKKRYRKK